MARKQKKNEQTEAQSDSIDHSVGEAAELNPKKNEQTEGQPVEINLSAGEAAELMQSTVNGMRQQWLQSAVTIANVLKNGQTVHRGTFEDLRQVRENYEELERARLHLQNLRPPAKTVVEAEIALSESDLNADAPVN